MPLRPALRLFLPSALTAWTIPTMIGLALFGLALCGLAWTGLAWSRPAQAAEFVDDAGRRLDFPAPPRRVASLSPAATEVVCVLEAHEALIAATVDDDHFEGLIGVPRVGSADWTDFGRLAELRPDLVIVPPELFEPARQAWAGRTGPALMVWDGRSSLAEADRKIEALGQVFQKTAQADATRAKERDFLETATAKTAGLPPEARPRTMRLAARDGRLFVPGRTSFQAEIIEAAGGRPPELGDDETELTTAAFLAFNPQFVYACGADRAAVEAFLAAPELTAVEAIKDGRAAYFPCSLTNRAAAHAGYLTAWLSTSLHPVLYGRREALIHPEGVVDERLVELDLPFVSRARTVSLRQADFIQKTLVIEFSSPQTVVSTSDGQREGLTAVGNSASPPMVWSIQHEGGWEGDVAKRLALLGLEKERTSLIFTGADIGNLVVKTVRHQDATVTALVTAGAESNAWRASRDVGAYYEPGTINVIVLSSRRLTPAAATAAVIVATEAKTAALWDLDVRSSQTPLLNPATGTGTDDVIVAAAGQGAPIDYVGGHSKIGQLVAEAVREAVTEALAKQNGLSVDRNVFARLRERGLEPTKLFDGPDAAELTGRPGWRGELVELLLSPQGAGLIETALSLDDAANMGRPADPTAFELGALALASNIAGTEAAALKALAGGPGSPLAATPRLRTALDALATGVALRPPQAQATP
ncbi:MAG: adenosylcobinamide amidohydrolase [Deltaproteobacteria bacterium]|nr:adenosylcobinamide amidohydrolase [Deltaproteobacteria bacterium]